VLRVMPSLETLRREIRHRICAHCHARSPDHRSERTSVILPCEKACSIFNNLARLRRTAELIDPMLASPRSALRRQIEDPCPPDVRPHNSPPTAQRSGAPADDPLRRYGEEVVDTVLNLVGER
jgi:hypothetical protein